MDINYHYYTVKTLAVHAGFNDRDAQYIAFFSQYIDDFIMNSPFTLDNEPPDFFIQNGLARKLRAENRWAFSPCTTGYNMLRMFSSGYRLSTLMPFHFIMPQPYYRLHRKAERSLYRCVTANKGGDLLINRLLRQSLQSGLMALGMVIHTFSDTFAHEGFSGFQGWENASYVHEGMPPAESALLRALPSIGHANAGTAPDKCGHTVGIYAKKSEKGPFEAHINRSNTPYFSDCSRRILDVLCEANKKTPPRAYEWDALQTKIARAQNGERGQSHEASWALAFPEIAFAYRKDEFVKIKLDILHHNADTLSQLKIKPGDLHDHHSEEGDRGRLSAITLACDVNDDFFRFNEAAYRHVFAATGEYCTLSHRTQLDTYCRMADSYIL